MRYSSVLAVALFAFFLAAPPVLAKKAEQRQVFVPVDIRTDGTGNTYGSRIIATNLSTCKKSRYTTRAGDARMQLVPGTYQIQVEASRYGFPQESRIDVLASDGLAVIASFPKSHVGVHNVVLATGSVLRVTLLPGVRPYNSSFFTIGGSNVAILLARPYPTMDYGVGAFNGKEQFSSAQIALGFWGMKHLLEKPELAQRIRTEGFAIDGGAAVHDPEVVLGAWVLADDLAQAFLKAKAANSEDVRGSYHTTLLVERTRDGKVPAALLKLNRQQLRDMLQRQLVWMLHHNMHRPAEGGGYAGATFMTVFQEGKKKALSWPVRSIESTQLLQQRVGVLEAQAKSRGLDSGYTPDWESVHTEEWADLEPSACSPRGGGGTGQESVRALLRETLKSLIRAALRERANYANYPTAWLENAASKLKPQTIVQRDDELKALITRSIDRLAQVAPGHEVEFR